MAKIAYRESTAEIFKELKLLRVDQINEIRNLNSDAQVFCRAIIT